ncbi:FAD/NAD(P)-binding protein [Arthrobacter sp. UM1]|uniref:FAD/NAD(P)-binding protein n=1 Tax=Arthrobacter sp. UM1 TaxID=2766776 RepID=UPI001CF6D9B7|nr:FAD/NAD(P)-binding protein [Arthrobacter sp. UM1]MCB4209083.1 FAD/NAD(P)-binding protein [Arthrobacter sp. UM1]
MTTRRDGQRSRNETSPVRVAVIGGGPRGLSAVERLAARAAESGRSVHVTVYEPFALGSGRVWRRDQSRQFLMNTPAKFPTAVPSAATLADAASSGTASPAAVVGPQTFEAFRRAVAAGEAEALTAEEAEELRAIGPEDYPRRATYGAYLERVAARLAESLPEGMTLEHRRETAVSVSREGVFRVTSRTPTAHELAPESHRSSNPDPSAEQLTVREADAVILALGHVDAELNPAQARARAKAGERYYPPSIPADVDWSRIPAGAGAVIRGMGLNFFDVVTELTQGRGGRFAETADGRLEYSPSGREPRITALSRRGMPYAAKPDFTADAPGPEPVFATWERFERMLADAPVRFSERVRPLLEADAQLAFHRVRDPQRADEWRRIEEAAAAPDASEALGLLADALASVPEAERLDLEALARPLTGREFASGEEHAAEVLRLVEADARSAQNPETEPRQHAVAALNRGRWALKGFIARGLITEDSRHRELRGWFEPLVEGLASGPPSRRMAELAGLIRAGVVRIAGPTPGVDYDEETGRFTVSSPWVPGAEHTGEVLVEAMMPVNSVRLLSSPLVRGLFESGLADAHRLTLDGAGYAGTGFAVDGPERTVLGADGTRTEGLHCLGLQLSSAEWGTAIAAETDGAWLGSAITLADADAVAAAVLSG